MTDLMDIIYACASDVLVSDILNEDGEYFSRVRYLENERDQLICALDKDTALKVNNLLDEKSAIAELRECACFCAGIRMASKAARAGRVSTN